MITLAELHPDKALADLLQGKVSIAISSKQNRIVKVYAQGERPNVNLSDEFIEILPNGLIRAMTEPMGVYRGNLALMFYCKAQSNSTAKSNRINSMLSQVESLTHYKHNGKFLFKINANNLITPLSYNASTGYTTTTINIEWHTTE